MKTNKGIFNSPGKHPKCGLTMKKSDNFIHENIPRTSNFQTF